jgi:hypothetical protein
MKNKKITLLEKEKIFENYINENDNGDKEKFRVENAIDIDVNDHLKKNINNNLNLKYNLETQEYEMSKIDYPKNISETFFLIEKSVGGICIENFLDSYVNVKKDLLEIVKYSGKYRKIVILKGNLNQQLTIFPFDKENWMFISKEAIKLWHVF